MTTEPIPPTPPADAEVAEPDVDLLAELEDPDEWPAAARAEVRRLRASNQQLSASAARLRQHEGSGTA